MAAPTDFDAFHDAVLPARLASALGRAAARDVHDAPSLAFRLDDGRSRRFLPGGDVLVVEPGDAADVVAALAAAAWEGFVAETCTAAGLHYGGRVRFARGGYADLERWEPALRALFQERPIFDPSAPCPVDDPMRRFGADAPDAALRDFLHAAGYLHVRGVFTAAEMIRLRDVVAREARAARPGDGRSWWATRADGTSVLCRLIYLSESAPEAAALADDPRIRRLAALVGQPTVPLVDRADGLSVVIKAPGAVEGLADLPWHRDCGLGGHPVICPGVNVGIQLDAATAETGQLHFVPGSWRASCHRADLARARQVAVTTAPGDVTVHFGDVMHAAPPPTGTGPGRRALYVSFAPPQARDAIPRRQGYNDVILARVGR